MFGDERTDYKAALQKYFEQGPGKAWELFYLKSYASSHPHKDWAETAHRKLAFVHDWLRRGALGP